MKRRNSSQLLSSLVFGRRHFSGYLLSLAGILCWLSLASCFSSWLPCLTFRKSLMNTKCAILALEDGRVFRGRSWAAEGESVGEMVFNTSMTGYQEVLTDPSYAAQIVCMTYPLIGNYGVNSTDPESSRPWVEGFVVREASRRASSWRSEESLDVYLKRWNIVAIDHIDTRALVRHIRDKGAMRACLSTIDRDEKSGIEKARNSPPMENRELASVVTTKPPYEFPAQGDERFHVV